jgi:hypothetical protein
MYKVIVERPRYGRWIGSGEGRRYRASEDVPSKQGMQQGYTHRKYLSENFSPLKRFIASQANRPWDKVYAEICANIDRRNTVQEHIFVHLNGFVVRETFLVEGKVVFRGWHAEQPWVPIEESRIELYVHPRTGILLRNRHRKVHVAKTRARRAMQAQEVAARRRILNQRQQLHCVEGIWYLVELADLPACPVVITRENGKVSKTVDRQTRWDALLKDHLAALTATGRHSDDPITMYGRHGVYAASKRQLSSRELKQHGLQQKGRDTSRPFCFGVPLFAYMLAV